MATLDRTDGQSHNGAGEERFLTRGPAERAISPNYGNWVGEWTRQRSKHDIARLGQERRIPCFPVNTVHDLFNDLHLKVRGLLQTSSIRLQVHFSIPGVPYRFSNTPLSLASVPRHYLASTTDIYLRKDERS